METLDLMKIDMANFAIQQVLSSVSTLLKAFFCFDFLRIMIGKKTKKKQSHIQSYDLYANI